MQPTWHLNHRHKGQQLTERDAKRLNMTKCVCGWYCCGKQEWPCTEEISKAQEQKRNEEKDDDVVMQQKPSTEAKEQKRPTGRPRNVKAERAAAATAMSNDKNSKEDKEGKEEPKTKSFLDMGKNLRIEDLAEMGPVLDKVPHELMARHMRISSAIAELILDANDRGDKEKMEELVCFFLFTQSYLLRSEGSGNRGHSRTHARYTAVEEQVRLILDADDENSSHEQKGLPQTDSKQKQSKEEEGSVMQAVKRATKLLRDGYVSKASRALMQKGLVDPSNPAVVAKMRQLHPESNGQRPECPPCLPTTISQKLILFHVQKMARKGSAAGLTKLNGNHILALTTNKVCFKLVEMIVNKIANAEFSERMRQFFLDSRGLALPKEEAAIRPIAIGDSFYRIAAECCIALDKAAWKKAAGPHALGSGVTAGCEAMATLAVNALEAGMAVARMDSTNAFNTRELEKISDAVYSNPEVSHSHKLFAWSYGKPTRILLQDKRGKGGRNDSVAARRSARRPSGHECA